MGYSIFDETMVDMTWPEVEKAAEEGAILEAMKEARTDTGIRQISGSALLICPRGMPPDS